MTVSAGVCTNLSFCSHHIWKREREREQNVLVHRTKTQRNQPRLNKGMEINNESKYNTRTLVYVYIYHWMLVLLTTKSRSELNEMLGQCKSSLWLDHYPDCHQILVTSFCFCITTARSLIKFYGNIVNCWSNVNTQKNVAKSNTLVRDHETAIVLR